MIYFIIRRLILTVFLLLLVSMITFAIFFLVPRLAGQTSYELAAQYVGRNPIPSEIKAVETKLGLDAPLYLQYGRYIKGIVFGTHYNAAPTSATARSPASATRSATSSRSGRSWSPTPRSRCRWPSGHRYSG